MELLKELGSGHRPMLSRQQKKKLDNAMAFAKRTLMPFVLQCVPCRVIVVPWNCTCLYASCHWNARLLDDMALVKGIM